MSPVEKLRAGQSKKGNGGRNHSLEAVQWTVRDTQRKRGPVPAQKRKGRT